MIYRISFFCVISGLIWGCQSPTAPPERAFGTGEEIHTDGPVVLDQQLQSQSFFGNTVKIVLEDHGHKHTATGTHEVWVRLRNVTDFDQYVQGRVHFLSGGGEEVEAPSLWQQIFLPAKSIETYRAMSRGRDEVKRFYVELREGR